ncbi:hypothetical protein DL93DRAFT_1763078 [Clavulina sp. PMI_390]|nr:hypothetical protein DL93DRAFT_1763078 [Clavulina sp. PMI_390]
METVESLRRENQERAAVSLPSEVLSQIFCIILQGSLGVPKGAFQHRYSLPKSVIGHFRTSRAVLCAVCFRWRKVMIGSANLWNVLNFPAKVQKASRTVAIPHSSYEILDTELSYAKESPLVLYVDSPFPVFDAKTRSEAVEKLRPLLSRSKGLFLDNYSVQHLQLMNLICDDVASTPLPSLMTLYATAYSGQPDPGEEEVIDLSLAPKIRELEIRAGYILYEEPSDGTSGPVIQLQLPGVDEFALTRIHFDGALDPLAVFGLVSHSPHLEEMFWSHEHFHNIHSDVYTSPLPVMEKLKHMELSGDIPIALTGSLVAPNLVRLELTWLREPAQAIWADRAHPLSNYLRFPHLRALIVTTPWESDREQAEMAHFIRAHPDLRVVRVPQYMSDELATALIDVPSIRRVYAVALQGRDAGNRKLISAWLQRGAPTDGAKPRLHLFKDDDEGDNWLPLGKRPGQFKEHVVIGSWPFGGMEVDDWDTYLFSDDDRTFIGDDRKHYDDDDGEHDRESNQDNAE